MAILALDLGTSSIKGIIIDEYGQIIASASYGYSVIYQGINMVEQSEKRWWEACLKTIINLLSQINVEIQAIGVTGQMHGCVVLDKDKKVIRPPIIWADRRTTEELLSFPDDTYSITGSILRLVGWGPVSFGCIKMKRKILKKLLLFYYPKITYVIN